MNRPAPRRKTLRPACAPSAAPGGAAREAWEKIPGWSSFTPIYALAVCEARPGDTLVEIGTYLGRSAAFMAAQIRSSGKILRFVSYDSYGWRGNPDWLRPSLARSRANLGDLGRYVDLVQSESEHAARLHAPASAGFVFLDGSHDAASVARDVRAWLPIVRPGGLIGGHDFDFPGARDAIEGLLGPGLRSDLDPASWLYRVPEAGGAP